MNKGETRTRDRKQLEKKQLEYAITRLKYVVKGTYGMIIIPSHFLLSIHSARK